LLPLGTRFFLNEMAKSDDGSAALGHFRLMIFSQTFGYFGMTVFSQTLLQLQNNGLKPKILDTSE
jgi:hypothetical protein